METSDFAQDIGPSTSQTTITEVVWTLPQLVAEIIAALQYASQNIPYSCAECTLGVLQTTVSRLSMFHLDQKRCHIWWHMA